MKYQYNRLRRLPVLLIALSFIQPSCKKTDGYNTVVSTDMTKPGVVTGIQTVNFDGGSTITYTLPNSENLLYVLAEYKINGSTSRQSKASYYNNNVTVSGFAKSQDYQVTLYTVSRAEVKSDPVTVAVHPDTPAYLRVLPTVVIQKDFGGVNITAFNKGKENIGVIVITPDKTNTFQVIAQNYTNSDSISMSLRGYDTIPRKFGVYITDQWGNISDTVYATITPIYETAMNKGLFQPYTLPTDAPTGFGWIINDLWDNNTGSPGYHTTQPIQPLVWPAVITFDMGQAARLSRYRIWDRGIDGSGNFLWQAGAPQTWVLWGRTSTPVDETMPDGNHLPPVGSTTPGGWINLGVFLLPAKPSGLPNPQYSNADLAFWNAGFSFNFSLALPKVRYIRFECIHNISFTDTFFNIEELSFWGDSR